MIQKVSAEIIPLRPLSILGLSNNDGITTDATKTTPISPIISESLSIRFLDKEITEIFLNIHALYQIVPQEDVKK